MYGPDSICLYTWYYISEALLSTQLFVCILLKSFFLFFLYLHTSLKYYFIPLSTSLFLSLSSSLYVLISYLKKHMRFRIKLTLQENRIKIHHVKQSCVFGPENCSSYTLHTLPTFAPTACKGLQVLSPHHSDPVTKLRWSVCVWFL